MTTITITSQSISAANGGFTGFNDRLVIPTANLDQTYAGQGSIAVTIKSFSTESGTLDEIWIGHQGTGNVYNFDGNQVQLFFAGVASKALTGAVTVTTDVANFNYIPTKPLIVSTHWSGTIDTGQSIAGPTNCNQYFSGASQAGTTSPTGVWSQDSIWTWVSSITLAEAQSFKFAVTPDPLRPNYQATLASTTQPTFTTFIPSGLNGPGQARNSFYETAVFSTTRPVMPVAPPIVSIFVGSVSKDAPLARDYRVMLADTTEPVAPIFTPPVSTIKLVDPPHQKLPFRRDYLAVAQMATTSPVWPQAPPGPAQTPTFFFTASLGDDRPMRPDYLRALYDTTQPICQISFRTAVTPTVYSNLTLQDDRPLRPDYRTALASTTQPVREYSFRTAATPSTYTNLSLQDDRPIRPDYSRALGDTTQPVLGLAFRTAITPAVLFEEAIPDERPRAFDYRVALGSTTTPALIVQPPPPAQTPAFIFQSLLDDRPIRVDYGRAVASTTAPVLIPPPFPIVLTPVAMATVVTPDPLRADYSRTLVSTTRPVAPYFIPPPVFTPAAYPSTLLDDRPIAKDFRVSLVSTTSSVAPIFIPPVSQPTLVGSPDSQLPRRADYSRALAAPATVISFQPCFTVGYTTIPTAGAGNSYTSGFDFANGPYTMPQTGVITSCSIWLDVGPVGTFQIGIYDAVSATQPGKLLALTNFFTPVAGWNTQPVTFPTAVAGGTSIFVGALNFGGSSPTKADPTVGINLYGDSGTNAVMDPVFQNPANLDATSFQLGAYATFCPAVGTPSTWFQTPYQANPLSRDYRVVLGDTTQPTEYLGASLPPLSLTPAYLGIAISGEVPTGGDYRVPLASTTKPVSAVYSPPIAFPNQLFLNSLGVTTHIGQGFAEANYEPMFTYTGIRVSREYSSAYNSLVTLHNNTVSSTYPGVKALIGSINPPTLTPGLTLDAAGALYGFEGPNEPNNFKQTYNGVLGGGSLSWVPIAQLQRDIYSTVNGNPTLSNYPVFGTSEAGAETDNVGLQYNTIPVGAGTSFPDGTIYQDFANIHNYVNGYTPGRPTYSFLAGPTPGVDGRNGEFIGVTWNKHFPAYSTNDGQYVPFVTTETGFDTGISPALTQDQQGKLYVNIYLAGFQAQMATGQKQAFVGIYEMVDKEGSSDTKGFYDINHVAKLSATYVHNMTTILADVGSNPTSRSLDFTVAGETANCHHFLLQRSDNTFYLILWGEEIVGGPTHNVTVSFKSPWNVSVYDVTIGTDPVSQLLAASSVPLTMQDHAKILQITPLQTDAGPPLSRVSSRGIAVFSTTSPVGPELLPTATPQSTYHPTGISGENPKAYDYRTVLLSTTAPTGPELLPTLTPPIVSFWVPNPDSIMPDWW